MVIEKGGLLIQVLYQMARGRCDRDRMVVGFTRCNIMW
jgi:hypothetical protein